MRIAYVCADRGVPVFGRKGCSIHVQEVIRAFLAGGASVELIAARFGGSPPPDLAHVRLHRLSGDVEGTDTATRERASLRGNLALRRTLDRLGPVDLVYERYSLWSFAAMCWARRSRVPGLLEVNAPLIEEQAEHRTLCDRGAATRVAARTFAAAHALIAVSREVARWVARFPEAADRVHVIPNGVDPSRFAPGCGPHEEPRSRDDGTFTIGFVGTLKAWHGLPVLLDAFSELHAEDQRTRLLVVGDGPERGALEDSLRRRGLQHAAVLTGAVGAEEIPSLLASMDVAVAPYAARPAFYFSPLKVLEYMAAGRAVVASRIGQLEELITHGQTGLLCAPDDPRALAACVRRIRQSPVLRQDLGRAARAAVAREHTWQIVVGRSLALAGLVLPSNGPVALRQDRARTEARA